MFLDLAGLQQAIREVRVLGIWRGRPAPEEALDEPLVRRRILTRALENQLVRAEVARRGLQADPAALDLALTNALAGRAPGAPGAEVPPRAALDARILAHFQEPAALVRRVAGDLLESERLAEALLDEVPEAELRADWIAAHTRRVLDVVQVLRVPSGAEIDAAEASRSAEIDAWYARHSDRFNQPERLSLRRIFRTGDGPEVQAHLEGLRARLVAGEDFAKLAQAESQGPQARRGGQVGRFAVKRLPPEVAGLAVNALSPVVAEPGGLAIYRVEARFPASERPLSSGTVRREIAATLLREADALPAAQALAAQVVTLLRADPASPQLTALLQPGQAQRHTTEPFARGGAATVPGIGLAPELFEAAFAAQAPGAVLGPFTVRQHYVIARVVRVEPADPALWEGARDAFIQAWRQSRRGSVVDAWLSRTLKDQALWVDAPALRALSRAELTGGTIRAAPAQVPDGVVTP